MTTSVKDCKLINAGQPFMFRREIVIRCTSLSTRQIKRVEFKYIYNTLGTRLWKKENQFFNTRHNVILMIQFTTAIIHLIVQRNKRQYADESVWVVKNIKYDPRNKKYL